MLALLPEIVGGLSTTMRQAESQDLEEFKIPSLLLHCDRRELRAWYENFDCGLTALAQARSKDFAATKPPATKS
jgi:hypothetical protein